MGVAMWWLWSAFAGPVLIPVQGELSHGAMPLDGVHTLTLALWSDAAATQLVHDEAQQAEIHGGAFAVNLGAAEALDASAFATDGGLWLTVQVGTEPASSAVPVAWAPRAAWASRSYTADHLGTQPAAAYQLTADAWTPGSGLSLNARSFSVTPYTGANFALSDRRCTGGQVMSGVSAAGAPECATVASGTSSGAVRYNTSNQRLEYYDGSNWIIVQQPLVATGGTTTDTGGYRVHRFTTNGTFAVTSGFGNIEVVVVGGGGGGAGGAGGGGGGGVTYSSAVAVNAGGLFTVTVGGGGAGAGWPNDGADGGTSAFGTITATGGGGGAHSGNGRAGGSGGGGGYLGVGGTPTSGQGYTGGGGVNAAPGYPGGGGGGAAGAGLSASGQNAGAGGPGRGVNFTGTTEYFGGGGGGNTRTGAASGLGGVGGGGNGTTGGNGQAGAANTGGGGGAGATTGAGFVGGNGGSGIVLVRYPI